MGTYVEYYHGLEPYETKQKKLVSTGVKKLLNFGGMMPLEEIQLYKKKLLVLDPIDINEEKDLRVYYNYFEDTFWENVYFEQNDLSFSSNKVGWYEFSKVVIAIHVLYNLCDKNDGIVMINNNPVNPYLYIAWINYVLGTNFSMKKCCRLFNNVEAYAFSNVDYSDELTLDEIFDMVPGYTIMKNVEILEILDLVNIIAGTESLDVRESDKKDYIFDVYSCKIEIKKYLSDNDDESLARFWNLITLDREDRERISNEKEDKLRGVAAWSLALPAKVLVYLIAEQLGQNFWVLWQKIYKNAYHDEELNPYVRSENCIQKQEQMAPVEQISTCDFLRQKDFSENDVPDKLKNKPSYIISDADRLFWWDGSDEVIISDETDQWIKSLAKQYKEIIEKGAITFMQGDDFLEGFVKLLSDINEQYCRIFPFQSMFYEFLKNGHKIEYQAAIELLKNLAKENEEDGSLIKYARDWDITSRKITHNMGRLKLKRYLAILANKELRIKYFGF